MDLKQIVGLAFQVSILCTVFGFGLKATPEDLLYVIRRPGLLARSLLAVFVIMPVFAVALARTFDFPREVEIALIALAISPVPPLLPKKETKFGGHAAFGLGLMACLATLSIVAVPAAVELLERFFSGRTLSMAPEAVAGVVLEKAILPLAAGMVLRAVLPAIAERLEKPMALVGTVLLPLATLVLLALTLPAVWALIGDGTVLAIAIFIVAGLGIGHILGGPDPDHSIILALSTASRHPGIALAIASANFPDERFGGAIVLYLIINAVAAVLYDVWAQRHPVGRLQRA
jgi:bile acid:Na+ symporter, BASS family